MAGVIDGAGAGDATGVGDAPAMIGVNEVAPAVAGQMSTGPGKSPEVGIGVAEGTGDCAATGGAANSTATRENVVTPRARTVARGHLRRPSSQAGRGTCGAPPMYSDSGASQ